MTDLSYTLVTDGSSDQVLKFPIDWLIRQLSNRTPTGQWADPAVYSSRPGGLRRHIQKAVENYPCELLFVHRDSETQPREKRIQEIQRALAGIKTPPIVCVIPVRMTEAWFLFDPILLRRAAGNPRGGMELTLPKIKNLENVPDPKAALHSLLRKASGAHGRRAKKFSPKKATHRLAELIENYSPLRALKAFRAFEADLRQILGGNHQQQEKPQ